MYLLHSKTIATIEASTVVAGLVPMIKKLLLTFVFLSLALSVVGAGFLVWGYHYITRDLPRLSGIEDYAPPAVSKVYANDETTLVAEFFQQRRYPVKIDEIPVMVRNAFLAAEDASFYNNTGVDAIRMVGAMLQVTLVATGVNRGFRTTCRRAGTVER